MNYILIALYVLLCMTPTILLGGDTTLPPAEAKARYEASAKEASIVFIPNRGQIVDSEGNLRPDLLFCTNGGGLKMYLRRTGISYVFARVEEKPTSQQGSVSEATGKPMQNFPKEDMLTDNPLVSVYRVDIELEGCNSQAEVLGEEETTQYFNYYLAHCPEGITNVHGYKRIVYKDIYTNIDLVFHSSKYGVKYDFVVRPGGDPADIKMRYENAGDIGLKANRLYMKTPLGAIEEEAPITYAISNNTYQPLAMNGRPVRSQFVLEDSTVGFSVEEYNRNQTLVIDPYVLWSTYIGGDEKEHVEGVVVITYSGELRPDSYWDQSVVVTGWTLSARFPTAAWNSHKLNSYIGETDAFLAEISSNGEMRWYTYFGGNKFDRANAIATVNPFRYSHSNTPIPLFYAITGQTRSESGIASAAFGYTAFQEIIGGKTDAFVATFDHSGYKIWATYIGGADEEYGHDIAIHIDGNIATIGITGQTYSSTFPVVPSGSATDWSFRGKADAFIATFTHLGQIEWARCFGGGYKDAGLAIDVDPNKNWLIGGWTKSTDMTGPVAIERMTGAGGGAESDVDMMIAIFSDNGAVLRSAYYGDQYDDYCNAVSFADNGENIIVGGYAHAVPNGMYSFFAKPYQQASYGGGSYDGVLLKFDVLFANEQTWWSTHYGGNNDDRIEDLAVDYYGDIWVVGRTNSSPTENIADGRLIGYEWDQLTDDWKVLQDERLPSPMGWDKYWPVYDTFITKFNPEGKRTWSSYYGKEGSNIGVSISSGYFYGIAVAGWTTPNHSDREIPLFHIDALQGVANDCDEGYVMLMREFGFPTKVGLTSFARSTVAVDSKDCIVFSADEEYNFFPVTPSAYQTTMLATDINGTIIKLDSSGAPIWGTYFGGTQNTFNPVVAVNVNDDILVGARQVSNFQNWYDPIGNGYLALFTKNGFFINSATIDAGPAKSVVISDVSFAPDGSVLVFGTTDIDVATAVPGRAGGFDGFIARYSFDLTSRESWKYWGGKGDDWLYAGTVTIANEIVIAGMADALSCSSSTPPFPRCGALASTPPGGNSDGFVSKLDCSGNCLWSRFIGGSSIDNIVDVDVAMDGTVVVVGTTHSSNFPVSVGTYYGNKDIVLTKLDGANGQVLWGTYVGGAGHDDVASLTIDKDGAVVLLGETQSDDYPTLNALQGTRLDPDNVMGCMTKFNSLNQMEWSTYLGGRAGSITSSSSFRSRIVTDSNNNYIFPIAIGTQTNFSREAFDYEYSVNGGDNGVRDAYYKLFKSGNLWYAP